MRGLLAFLQQDVEKLRPGALIDVATDVLRILDSRAVITGGDEIVLGSTSKLPKPLIEAGRGPLIPRAFLQSLQDSIRSGMGALSDGKEWSPFDDLSAEQPPPRWTLRVAEDRTLQRRYEGRLMTALLESAADLLATCWPALLRCAYAPCGAYFLPTHGRQRFHDPKCSQLARWHKWSPKRDLQTEKERRVLRNGPGRGKGRRK